MLKFGYLRQDDDSHWYLVSEDVIKNFDNILNQIEEESDFEKREELIDLFIETFDGYRLSGGCYDLKIQMEDK